jgi:hypothetical protein
VKIADVDLLLDVLDAQPMRWCEQRDALAEASRSQQS